MFTQPLQKCPWSTFGPREGCLQLGQGMKSHTRSHKLIVDKGLGNAAQGPELARFPGLERVEPAQVVPVEICQRLKKALHLG